VVEGRELEDNMNSYDWSELVEDLQAGGLQSTHLLL